MSQDGDTPTPAIPIVCRLPAAEQAERREVLADVFSQAQQVTELPDGFAFQFPGGKEWAERLLAAIDGERGCCPFFVFELVFEANHGPLWLRARGGPGVKEFLQDQIMRESTPEAAHITSCSCCG